MTRLAPWRDRSGQAFLTDVELLETVAGRGPVHPAGLTDGRRRESVLRVQCRYLAGASLLTAHGHDRFELTETGQGVLDGDVSVPIAEGYVDLDATIGLPDRRLTNFTDLTPAVLKQQNRQFLENGTERYEYVRGGREATEQRIRNVRASLLRRLTEEVPHTEPVDQQCAHWMRAMVGIHPFPDASHRTGIATIRLLLEQAGYEELRDGWPETRIDRTVTKSKLLRLLYTQTTLNKLWLRDELYHHWRSYFRSTLFGDPGGHPAGDAERPDDAISTTDLTTILERSRETLSN